MKHHLESLEQDGLECRHAGGPSARGGRTAASAAVLGGEGGALVVQRDDAGGAQDRLVQPAHAEEQQQDADDQLQQLERYRLERAAERGDQRGQRGEPRGGAEQRRAPAMDGADGEHDRERFDDLDEGSGERGCDGGENGGPGEHRRPGRKRWNVAPVCCAAASPANQSCAGVTGAY
jgi:hypothetical protein